MSDTESRTRQSLDAVVDAQRYAQLKDQVQSPALSQDMHALLKQADRAALETKYASVKNEHLHRVAVEGSLLLGESAASVLSRSAATIEKARSTDRKILAGKEGEARMFDQKYLREEKKMRDLCRRSDDLDYVSKGMQLELEELHAIIHAKQQHQPFTGKLTVLPADYRDLSLQDLERDRMKMERTFEQLQRQLAGVQVDMVQQHYTLQQLDQVRVGYRTVIGHMHEGMLKKAKQHTPFLLPEFIKVWKANADVMKTAEKDEKLYQLHQDMSDALLGALGDVPLHNPYADRFAEQPPLSLQVFSARTQRFYEGISREARSIRELYQ